MPKEEFSVIIDSLGNSSLSFLSSSGVRFVRIFANEQEQTADIEICLSDDTWEKRARAIHGMVEIREMFMDDLSIDYAFVSCEEGDESGTSDGEASELVSREFALS